MKNLSKDKDGLLVSNASLAEYNLSLEPKLITARQQLADVYVKAVELQKQHERNMMLIGMWCLLLNEYIVTALWLGSTVVVVVGCRGMIDFSSTTS